MAKQSKITLIIDGNNLAHRCRHSFDLTNKGVDVSVTYGFLRTLGSLINKFKPESVIVCWDGGTPNFRRVAVPEYKCNRDHGDQLEYEDFLRQLHELCDYVFPMTGVISVRKVGAEADDLMYHATKILDGKFIIVTTDHDLYQAVSLTTNVYNPTKEKLITLDNFEDEVGIDKGRFIDWKALQGDSSDNIPGVVGIGEKTATKLFNELGTLTGITNAAVGKNPNGKGKMSDRVRDSIVSFGFERICKNIFVMALYADRVGARQALTDAVMGWKPGDPKRLKKYIMMNAFVSLLDTLPGQVLNMHQPYFIQDVFRAPTFCARRVAIL